MKEIKKIMRREILSLRDRLTEEEVNAKSGLIFESLMNMDAFRKSLWIMTYINFRSEVSTRTFIKACLDLGKRVAVPLVKDEGNGKRELWACEINNLENDLEVSSYGILEPKKQYIRRIDPRLIDMVVVPGVAFDAEKFRIGYGAGYYDRFLKIISKDCLKVGVAFEIQIVNKIPVEKHDAKVDIIITEGKLIY